LFGYSHVYVSRHGSEKVKFASAQEANQIYQCKNTKEKLYNIKTAVWYKRIV